MSPPIELFLTTIVSSPALRQRQGNPVLNDPSTPTADYVHDLGGPGSLQSSSVSTLRPSRTLALR